MIESDCQTSFDVNGYIESERFRLNGKLHNENGPAVVWYNVNGDINTKCYCLFGEIHNDYGPAWVEYDENGKVKYEAFWHKGKKVSENFFQD